MVLIAGKEPGLSAARIIRGELIVINTRVFTAFSRLLIARDPFEPFGSGEGSYPGFEMWVWCWGRRRRWESWDPWLHLPGWGWGSSGCLWRSIPQCWGRAQPCTRREAPAGALSSPKLFLSPGKHCRPAWLNSPEVSLSKPFRRHARVKPSLIAFSPLSTSRAYPFPPHHPLIRLL